MFVVVRNVKSQGGAEPENKYANEYKINKGDTIKMGRLKFSVKDYRSDSHAANMDGDDGSPVKKQAVGRVDEQDFAEEEIVEIECGTADAADAIQCKVCWSDEQPAGNPLLSSCDCDGSVRYIHFECLKHWLKQKMTFKEDETCVSYTWKQFECEICKKPYPYVFRSQGQKFRLVDIDLPREGNFLWLESLTFEKNSSRIVHVIKPAKDVKTEFKMGRGHESDLRVSDISVSRCHAILKYDAEHSHRYYLEDNLSKFGTLVLANSPQVELELDQTKAIQIGRSVISFTVKRLPEPQPVERPQHTKLPLFQPHQVLKTPSPTRHKKQNFDDAEEVLRQKIEETNQKINDYLVQTGNAPTTASQLIRRQQREDLEPRRLNFGEDPQPNVGLTGSA